MPLRQTPNVTISILSTSNFMLSLPAGDTLSVVRGSGASTLRVAWTQGIPQVSPLNLASFAVAFYTDATFGTPLTTGTDFSIGNQLLSAIVRMISFMDGGSGSGTVEIEVDPSGITVTELAASRDLYIRVQVDQPDP